MNEQGQPSTGASGPPHPDLPVDSGLEVLSTRSCMELLATVPIGRIAFMRGGAIQVLPINYLMDGNAILFRTAAGGKLAAAIRGDDVTFQTDHWDEDSHTGWSVMLIGTAEVVEADIDIERYEGAGLYPWANLVDRPTWVRIRARDVTGRRVLHLEA